MELFRNIRKFLSALLLCSFVSACFYTPVHAAGTGTATAHAEPVDAAPVAKQASTIRDFIILAAVMGGIGLALWLLEKWNGRSVERETDPEKLKATIERETDPERLEEMARKLKERADNARQEKSTIDRELKPEELDAFVYQAIARAGMRQEAIRSAQAAERTREMELAGEFQCICLELANKNDPSVVQLECGHLYHKKCLAPWFKQKKTCPHCRNPVDKKFIRDHKIR